MSGNEGGVDPFKEGNLTKSEAVEMFRHYTSPFKAEFYDKFGMQFAMGKREGPRLYDMEGDEKEIHSVYNLHVNGGVFNLGHRNEITRKALVEAVEEVDIGNHHLTSQWRARLAKALADNTPGDLKWTIFGVSGGEAIDLAIKMCWGYTRKRKIIVAVGAYHGNTGLSVFAGDKKFLSPFNLYYDTYPEFVRVPFGDTAAILNQIDGDTAGVLLETVPATLGMPIPPKDYYLRIREACDEFGAQLIADEVQTGMGRSGGKKIWAIEHFGVTPDILVAGKGMSGGVYPLSITTFRDHLASVFKQEPFAHVSTFGGSEVGCRVSLKLLEETRSERFLSHIEELSQAWQAGLEKLKNKQEGNVVEVRQLGLFIGLRFSNQYWGPVMTKTTFSHGLLCVYAANDPSCLQILPPLNMPLEDVDMCIDLLDKAISSASLLVPVYALKKKSEAMFPFANGASVAPPPPPPSVSPSVGYSAPPPSSSSSFSSSSLILQTTLCFFSFFLLQCFPEYSPFPPPTFSQFGALFLGYFFIIGVYLFSAKVVSLFKANQKKRGGEGKKLLESMLNGIPVLGEREKFKFEEKDFEDLEKKVGEALEKGSMEGVEGLKVLGYGEVSVVLLLDTPTTEKLAVKRMAGTFDLPSLHAHCSLISTYITRLHRSGVICVPTAFYAIPTSKKNEGEEYILYLVQPLLEKERLLPEYLRECGEEEGVRLLGEVMKKIRGVVSERMGLDSQTSNWYLSPTNEILYLDVSTPFMTNPTTNQQLLHTDVFLQSFPSIITPIASLAINEIMSQYHVFRTVIVDLIGNLQKEKLDHLVPIFVNSANSFAGRFKEEGGEITVDEVKKFYVFDSKMYAFLQALRRGERWVRRNVLGKSYPFLLPPVIER